MVTTKRILGEANVLRLPKDDELTEPSCAYFYAKNVMGSRWKRGEETIKMDPGWAYMYARYVLRGRWLEAEDSISRETHAAMCYAVDIMKSRWLEMEPRIAKNAEYPKYLQAFPEAKDDWVLNGWIDWMD